METSMFTPGDFEDILKMLEASTNKEVKDMAGALKVMLEDYSKRKDTTKSTIEVA